MIKINSAVQNCNLDATIVARKVAIGTMLDEAFFDGLKFSPKPIARLTVLSVRLISAVVK